MKNGSLVYIYSMGCHQRLLDAQKISDYLKINEFKIVKDPYKADYIILNTCAFKESQELFAIKKVEEFKKLDKKLIVGGCLPAINKEGLERIFNGPVFTPTSIEKLDDIFNVKIKFRELPDANRMFQSILSDPTHFRDIFRRKMFNYFILETIKSRILRRKKYFIRISWGCLGKCSYCSIKNAIGSLKSKSVQECLNEFKRGVSLGYKDFMLVAEDLGAYGLDIGTTLPDLLRAFLEIKGNYKFYLIEMHPRWIIKYLNELIPIVKMKKIKRITCTIQSGSNKILGLMNRFHRAKEIKNALNKLREADRQLIIFTHIIIGFPGETEEDFEETIKLLKDIKTNYTCLYPYCERASTPSAALPNKVSRETIEERIKKAKEAGV